SLQQSFATARRQIPPALGGPAAVGILVAYGDADAAAGVVAKMEIGIRSCGREQEDRGDQKRSDRGKKGQDQAVVPYFVQGRVSREGSRPVNDDGAKVVDVGAGRPRDHEVAQ